MRNLSILSCKIKIKGWFTPHGGKHKMMTNFKGQEVLTTKIILITRNKGEEKIKKTLWM
jgi:hypothetical protein